MGKEKDTPNLILTKVNNGVIVKKWNKEKQEYDINVFNNLQSLTDYFVNIELFTEKILTGQACLNKIRGFNNENT